MRLFDLEVVQRKWWKRMRCWRGGRKRERDEGQETVAKISICRAHNQAILPPPPTACHLPNVKSQWALAAKSKGGLLAQKPRKQKKKCRLPRPYESGSRSCRWRCLLKKWEASRGVRTRRSLTGGPKRWWSQSRWPQQQSAGKGAAAAGAGPTRSRWTKKGRSPVGRGGGRGESVAAEIASPAAGDGGVGWTAGGGRRTRSRRC